MKRVLGVRSEPKELRPRAGAAAVIVALMMLVLVARLYHLQLVRGDELSTKSRDNYVKELVEPADRGLVVDRRGRVLADNRPSFDVYITPGDCLKSERPEGLCRKTEEVLDRLALRLDLTPEEVESVKDAIRGMRRSRESRLELFRPYLVKLDISRDELDVIQTERALLDSIDVIPSPHRNYRYGPMLAHVIGYMSEVSQSELDKSPGRYRRGDFIGRRGLERSMESHLRGEDGTRRIAVDAKGRPLDQDTANQLISEENRRVPGRPGHNVITSIDIGLQAIAEKAMQKAAIAGAAVVIDVHTGGVLAMVSLPSYDPNRMSGRISRADLKAIVDDPLQPLFQRAVQQHYPPGSAFKVVTALAALQNDIVEPDHSTFCGGGYTLGRRRWRCHKESGHGHGVGLKRSLQVSCDTYYYWLADRMGLDPIAEAARAMGFGSRTGIELSPEAPGIVPDVAFHERVDKGYTKGFALNASIGQGSVNATPLQVAVAFAAIANGGTLYRPRLVNRIEDAHGAIVKDFPPEVVRDLKLDPVHQAALMDGLRSVVEEPGGTAYSRRLADIETAGKTGTSQVIVIGSRRLKAHEMPWEHRDHAWYAGIAPVDEPEIAIAILNEHGGGGSRNAAPVAMEIIQGYFDIKRREAETGQPLSDVEIAQLEPEARLAGWSPPRPRPAPAAAPTVPRYESERAADSSPAERADPELLRDIRTPPPRPVARPPADAEARPPPEE